MRYFTIGQFNYRQKAPFAMSAAAALRRITGLSLRQCEKALTASATPIDALEALNPNHREQSHGFVGLIAHSDFAALVHVHCKSVEHQEAVKHLTESIVKAIQVNQGLLQGKDSIKTLNQMKMAGYESVEQALTATTSKLLNRVKIRDLVVVRRKPTQALSSFLLSPASPGVGVAGCVLCLEGTEPMSPEEAAKLAPLGESLCRQALASRPKYISTAAIPKVELLRMNQQTAKGKAVSLSLTDDRTEAMAAKLQSKMERFVLSCQPALFGRVEDTVEAHLHKLALTVASCHYMDARWRLMGMRTVT